MNLSQITWLVLRVATLIVCLAFAPIAIWRAFQEDVFIRYWIAIFYPILAVLALSIWYLVFGWVSPFKKRAKHFGLFLGASVVLLIALVALFRYDGSTSGSSVPKFVVRWAPEDVDRSAALVEGEAVVVSSDSTAGEPVEGVVDSPELYGPGRNATWTKDEVIADLDWTSNPPEELWRKPVGLGWSGFAVAGRRAITIEQRGDNETVICYDLLTGDALWSHQDVARYYLSAPTKAMEMAGDGPRSVPTIHGSHVYTYGATGILNCLRLETGEVVWRRDLSEDPGIKLPEWGLSCSPLIIDDLNLVVVAASLDGNPTLLAAATDTGETVWEGKGTGASYSSPRLMTLHGERQIVSVNFEDVSGYDPKSGDVRWSFPWKGRTPKVGQPIEAPGNRILVTASYGVGSHLLQIERDGDAWTAESLWKSTRLKTKFSSAQVHGGYAYGLDESRLACVSLEDGSRVWKDGKYGFGQNLLLGDQLMIQAEAGYVVIVEASPEGLRETARLEALESMTWNPPTLAGRYLLVRNDQEAICFRLPAKTAP